MITTFLGGCDCSSSKLSSSRRSVQGDRSPYQKWFTALLRVGAPLAHGLANITRRFGVYRGSHTSQEIGRGTNQSPAPCSLPPQPPAMARQPLAVTRAKIPRSRAQTAKSAWPAKEKLTLGRAL